MRKNFGRNLMLSISLLVLAAGGARGADISGTITTTLIITDDSQLVGDVTCTVVHAPCVQFGADDITLRLNGFTMTGLADPTTGCDATSATAFFGEDGIDTAGHSHLQILGPGLVQDFRSVGVIVQNESTKVKVRHVTTSTNCICGILLFNKATDNDVEDNVALRIGHRFSGCGGINAFTDNNRVRRNVVSGNGYALETPGNFGINIRGIGNLIEENVVVGNTNGIRVSAAAHDNVVRRNVITGNPPIQVSLSFPTSGGVDILDLSPATVGRNTFEDNLCLTSNVSGLCPNINGLSVFIVGAL
jgi:parallel beta-helix repeat protein